MKKITAISTLIFLVLIGCDSKEQFEEGGIGALEGIVSIGESDGWTGSMQSGIYRMENHVNPDSVQYYYTKANEANGTRTSSVDVKVEATSDQSRAGLLYAFQEAQHSYYLMVVNANGLFEVFRRDADGFRVMTGSSFEPSVSGFQHIELRENGKELSMTVNGKSMGTIESSAVGNGALGIAAIGVGRFDFTNYQATPTGKPTTVISNTHSPIAKNEVVGTPATFKQHALVDRGRGGFPAYHFLAPKGWTFEGELKSAGQAYSKLPYIGDAIVTAPDGRFVHFFPFMTFGYNDQVSGTLLQPFDGRLYARLPETLGQFMIGLARADPNQKIRDIQIVSDEILPDATELVRRQSAALYQQAQNFNNNSGYTGQRFYYDKRVHRLEMTYHTEGKHLREIVFATMSSSVITYANGSVKAGVWSLGDMYSIGGPVGGNQLDDPLLATIIRSRRINPDWAYAIDQFFLNERKVMIKEGIAAAAAAQRTWKPTSIKNTEDVLDISFKGWKDRSSLGDAGQSNLVDSIHERTPYITPTGENIDLPSFYQNAYTDGQGNFVLHNDANYQINTDPNFNKHNWERLSAVR